MVVFNDQWGQGGRRQFVAEATPTGIAARVQDVSGTVFDRLEGTDNMVVIYSDRYRERPLVIQGAGAGPVVTAGGVLSDVIRAAELLA